MPLDLKNHKKVSLYGYYYVYTFGTHSVKYRVEFQNQNWRGAIDQQ